MTAPVLTTGSFGAYSEVPPTDPLSSMDLTILPLDIVVQWRRCGITADYVASFLAYSFDDQDRVMVVLSSVLNELLENAVKFSANKQDLVTVSVRYDGEVMQIEATNRGRAESMDGLRQMIERINERDIEDLFVEQVEQAAANDAASSGLGFITLVKDYGARVGVRIEPPEAGVCEVRVQVRLDIDEVVR